MPDTIFVGYETIDGNGSPVDRISVREGTSQKYHDLNMAPYLFPDHQQRGRPHDHYRKNFLDSNKDGTDAYIMRNFHLYHSQYDWDTNSVFKPLFESLMNRADQGDFLTPIYMCKRNGTWCQNYTRNSYNVVCQDGGALGPHDYIANFKKMGTFGSYLDPGSSTDTGIEKYFPDNNVTIKLEESFCDLLGFGRDTTIEATYIGGGKWSYSIKIKGVESTNNNTELSYDGSGIKDPNYEKYYRGNAEKNAIVDAAKVSGNINLKELIKLVLSKQMGDVLQVAFTLIYKIKSDESSVTITTGDCVVFVLCLMLQCPCIYCVSKKKSDYISGKFPSTQSMSAKMLLLEYYPVILTPEERFNGMKKQVIDFNNGRLLGIDENARVSNMDILNGVPIEEYIKYAAALCSRLNDFILNLTDDGKNTLDEYKMKALIEQKSFKGKPRKGIKIHQISKICDNKEASKQCIESIFGEGSTTEAVIIKVKRKFGNDGPLPVTTQTSQKTKPFYFGEASRETTPTPSEAAPPHTRTRRTRQRASRTKQNSATTTRTRRTRQMASTRTRRTKPKASSVRGRSQTATKAKGGNEMYGGALEIKQFSIYSIFDHYLKYHYNEDSNKNHYDFDALKQIAYMDDNSLSLFPSNDDYENFKQKYVEFGYNNVESFPDASWWNDEEAYTSDITSEFLVQWVVGPDDTTTAMKEFVDDLKSQYQDIQVLEEAGRFLVEYLESDLLTPVEGYASTSGNKVSPILGQAAELTPEEKVSPKQPFIPLDISPNAEQKTRVSIFNGKNKMLTTERQKTARNNRIAAKRRLNLNGGSKTRRKSRRSRYGRRGR